MKYVIVLLALMLSACASLSNTQTASTEYGEFAYYSSGSNTPTLVFESGMADNMSVWQRVINKTNDKYQVFAYNRAGFSGSESSNAKRNGANIVVELNSLLATNNIKPPLILIGHSLGGGYMELYAKTYPNQVAGVVLVDPNSSKYPKACRDRGLDYCEPPSSIPNWASLFLPDAVKGEIEGFADTHKQINAIDAFPQVPLFVITAQASRRAETEKEKLAAELYLQMHKELTELSPNSKHYICDTCQHDIHIENPELVVEGIEWVINNAN